jgi:O-antigen/teichoic acid export membrane protein
MQVVRLVVSTFGAAGATFLLQLLVARTLPVSEYGQYAAINSIVAVVSPIACSGIVALLLRRATLESKSASELTSVASLALAISSTVAISLTPFLFFQSDVNLALIFCLASLYWGVAGQNLLVTLAQLHHRSWLLTLSQGILPTTRLLFVLLTAATASSLGHISAALLVANIFSTLIFLKIAKRIFKVSVGKSSLASLRMILGSIPYSINGVVNVAQIQLTVTFAALLFGSKEAALFSVAITLLNAIFILPNTIFGLYLLPKYHKLDFSVSRNVPLLNAAYAFLLGLTISVGFWKLSSLVIATLFGAEYRAATENIEILIWTVTLRFFSTGIGAALLSERLVRWKVFCSGLGLALQVGLFILCVDEGPHEIAYAVIVGEFTVAALYASLFINYAGRPAFK